MNKKDNIYKKTIKVPSGKTIRVVKKSVSAREMCKAGTITESDLEMDLRAKGAIKAAIEKKKICGKPIARYDIKEEIAYLEYPDGRRETVR